MSGIPPGLVRFCLEHTDSAELSNNPPSLSAEDADFLQKAFSVIEDDPKRLKRHLAVAASATASAEEVIEACEEIRELVEQIDNACDLAPLGGWPVLVSLLGGRPASAPAGGAAGAAGAGSSAVLASEAPIGASTHATDEGVRAATLACVRAAVANNPRGLVAAAHCGTVRPVVDILVAANTTDRIKALAASTVTAMCGVSTEISDAIVGFPYACVATIAAECARGSRASGRYARLLAQLMRSCIRERTAARELTLSTGACAALLWLAGIVPSVVALGDGDNAARDALAASMPVPPSPESVGPQDREGALQALVVLATADSAEDLATSEDLRAAAPCRAYAAEVAAAAPGILDALEAREAALAGQEDQDVVADELALVRKLTATIAAAPPAR
eukprot:TRINITY_DN64_c0_g1_i2.p2 TRINITY_DN64_c0_g1~~TRINITY_DN64_c0_g1_i2.p2  ORF type:complete len:392 (+),score=199.95 TRINITY_DN64_c0_g1_i2:1960-3135(+)